jgi:hypothetical protein
MNRREFTRAQKAQIVLRATNGDGRVTCEGCGLVLGRKPYEIDHTIPEAMVINKTKPLTIEDGKLLGKACCHRGGKTAKDQGDIARAKRRQIKDMGIPKRSTFPKPPPGYKYSWKSGRMEKVAP